VCPEARGRSQKKSAGCHQCALTGSLLKGKTAGSHECRGRVQILTDGGRIVADKRPSAWRGHSATVIIRRRHLLQLKYPPLSVSRRKTNDAQLWRMCQETRATTSQGCHVADTRIVQPCRARPWRSGPQRHPDGRAVESLQDRTETTGTRSASLSVCRYLMIASSRPGGLCGQLQGFDKDNGPPGPGTIISTSTSR